MPYLASMKGKFMGRSDWALGTKAEKKRDLEGRREGDRERVDNFRVQ
jgi:hypothetical protein